MPTKRRIEVSELKEEIDQVWDLYSQLQLSLSLLDPTRSIELVVLLHNSLCKLMNGTPQEQCLMMDFETNILPSCIREICYMSSTAQDFIFGKRKH